MIVTCGIPPVNGSCSIGTKPFIILWYFFPICSIRFFRMEVSRGFFFFIIFLNIFFLHSIISIQFNFHRQRKTSSCCHCNNCFKFISNAISSSFSWQLNERVLMCSRQLQFKMSIFSFASWFVYDTVALFMIAIQMRMNRVNRFEMLRERVK